MKPLTISAVTTHIVKLFEKDERLRDVWLTGEISGWKKATSGHIYFTLKDGGATLAAVMWKGNAYGLNPLPQNGDQVVAHGYIGVYPDRGAYQFYADTIQPAGVGELYRRFEEIKARLAAEGLFAAERKRPIPPQPERIGIITSSATAALRDILKVVRLRWPLVELILFHTAVQGREAPAGIVAALQAANRYSAQVEPLQTLLLARGGGSIEDLWAFNDEQVARAIVASAVPIITGIGHETDSTIADFVADLRTATPSTAAAAAVPDGTERLLQLRDIHHSLTAEAQARIQQERSRLTETQQRLLRLHPRRQLDQHRQRLDEGAQRLQRAMSQRLAQERERVTFARLRLEGLNPEQVLARGFSIVQDEQGAVVTGPTQVPPGATLRVRAMNGEYRVQRLLICGQALWAIPQSRHSAEAFPEWRRGSLPQRYGPTSVSARPPSRPQDLAALPPCSHRVALAHCAHPVTLRVETELHPYHWQRSFLPQSHASPSPADPLPTACTKPTTCPHHEMGPPWSIVL